MIGIIDYGMGNIHSVQKALQSMGAETVVTNRPSDIVTYEKIVLPGVGAFDDAVLELEKRALVKAIKDAVGNNKIFLGICLGMQLLFPESEEARDTKGLNLIKGAVRKFAVKKGFKVPHMGWNQLNVRNRKCPILKGVPDKSYVYFCHSYYPAVLEKEIIAATCDYITDFTSLLWKENIYGVQFHPEKSQGVGLKILRNFVEL